MRKLVFFLISAGSLLIMPSAHAFPNAVPTRNGDLIGLVDSVGTTDSGTFLASYGQLSISSYEMNFYYADEWSPIAFNSTGPSSHMSVTTTSPATLTIQQTGVYQINFSLYFSVEESDEDMFTVTNYTVGLDINGVTTPVAAVYAHDRGYFSLNYSALMDCSAGDNIQFYIKASDAEGPSFSNNVTLENGKAYLMQISN